MIIEELDIDKDPFGMGMNLPEGHLIKEDQSIIVKHCTGKDLVVNLGTFRGRSSVLMSYFAKNVITVDCYVDPSFNHQYILETIVKKYHNIKAFEGDSAAMSKVCQNDTVDFLFQDAGHSIKCVYDDVSAWLPKMKRGAFIGFHDYKYQDGSCDESMDVVHGVEKLVAHKKIKPVGLFGWTFIAEVIK